jgi:hypothetical protein
MGQCCLRSKTSDTTRSSHTITSSKPSTIPNGRDVFEITSGQPTTSRQIKREQLASAAEQRLKQSTYRGASSGKGKLSERLMEERQHPMIYEQGPSKEETIAEMVSYSKIDRKKETLSLKCST